MSKRPCSRLAGNVAPLRSEWVGSAQAQFEALWDQWQRDATGLHSALTGIAQLTRECGDVVRIDRAEHRHLVQSDLNRVTGGGPPSDMQRIV